MADRFAVLGSPVSHSRSPLLHNAAIRALVVDADYTAIEVTEAQLPGFLRECDSSFQGFSLTMPLKQAVRPLLASECDVSTLTGSVNTIVRGNDGWHGFNTDVWGARRAIEQTLGSQFRTATILGAGATAASLLVALHQLGVRNASVVVRETGRAQEISRLATSLGVTCDVEQFGAATAPSDILVNTLPASAELSPEFIEDLDAGALFDVVYEPWPTTLAREWSSRGLPTTGGLVMLLWQAARQARVFYGDDVDEELPNESMMITAMRSAVGL